MGSISSDRSLAFNYKILKAGYFFDSNEYLKKIDALELH